MYAVFEDSGRQFKVHENETIEVDPRELPEGTAQLEFDKVLLIGDEQKEGATKVVIFEFCGHRSVKRSRW